MLQTTIIVEKLSIKSDLADRSARTHKLHSSLTEFSSQLTTLHLGSYIKSDSIILKSIPNVELIATTFTTHLPALCWADVPSYVGILEKLATEIIHEQKTQVETL